MHNIIKELYCAYFLKAELITEEAKEYYRVVVIESTGELVWRTTYILQYDRAFYLSMSTRNIGELKNETIP
jgi:hypothetical protein